MINIKQLLAEKLLQKIVTIGKKYRLNHNGDPILSEGQERPKLKDNKVDEIPILGIPLLSFKNTDKRGKSEYTIGKDTADELW